MKKVLHSVVNDLGKNKFFTLLTMLEILVLVIVASSLMMSFQLDNTQKKAYKSEHAQAIVVEIEHYKGEEIKDFDNLALSYQATFANANKIFFASVINANLTKYFNIPYSGEWFSQDYNDNYKQGLVSAQYKKQYKKGEIYTFVDEFGKEYNVKIIGYLGKENMTIRLGFNQYNAFFSAADILMCDNITPQKFADTNSFSATLITSSHTAEYFTQNFDCSAQTIQNAYETYKRDKFPFTYYISVICGILFLIINVSVLCNSIFRVEKQIRRNVVKQLAGASPLNIASCEILKTAIVIGIPFALDVIIASIMIAATKSDSSFPIISWRGFGIASAMVLIAYVLSIAIGSTRVLTANMLKELKK